MLLVYAAMGRILGLSVLFDCMCRKSLKKNQAKLTGDVLDHGRKLESVVRQIFGQRVELVRSDHDVGMTAGQVRPELAEVVPDLMEPGGSVAVGNLDPEDLEAVVRRDGHRRAKASEAEEGKRDDDRFDHL